MDWRTSPFLEVDTLPPDMEMKVGEGGVLRLRSRVPLGPVPERVTERLHYWADRTPDRVFLARRVAGADWRELTFEQVRGQMLSLAQGLLDLGLTPERPIAILSGNSLEHGLLALAAMHIGIPYSPISPAYSLRSRTHEKLRHCLEVLNPSLIFVQNGRRYAPALAAVSGDLPVVAVSDVQIGQLPFEQLSSNAPGTGVAQAHARVAPDTPAKVLFTSGSTGMPKGVINTHGNLCTNWQQITQVFPLMSAGGLRLIDWLPWNHTFGGNHNFGLCLYNGGSLYIDDGKPTPDGIAETLRNLGELSPTVYFNVPKGFELMIPRLDSDPELGRHFFKDLKLLFYAGASMSQKIWDGLERLAVTYTGKRVLIATGLGMTEASPSALFNTEYGSKSGRLGVPVPGLSVKLVPDGDKLEARIRGGNISPGYWRNQEATTAAFDEEGYYRTGDAVKLLDPEDPNQGLVFDGRISEEFKLDTGTWVRVGPIKAALVHAGEGLIRDAVITGLNRSYVGAIVFPDPEHAGQLTGLPPTAGLAVLTGHPAMQEALGRILETLGNESTGSSTHIRRALWAEEELSLEAGEITDKGSVNQRAVLAHRPELVERLYAERPAAAIVEHQTVSR